MGMTDKKGKVLIVTGGAADIEFVKNFVENEVYSMVIAADHGLILADLCHLELDYIVGDFDSVPETLLGKYRDISTPIQTFPTEKDKTDTQIALELALMHNPDQIDIVGATGSRLDHVLANIHLLLLPLQLEVPGYIIDQHNKIYLKKECFTIEKEKQYGNFVSLLPFTDKVSGLTLKGFKYPLNSITLAGGSSLGISNEIREEIACVEFTQGTLIVIESRD